VETLTALDSAFLQLEDQHSALHIGSVAVFEGPVPGVAVVRDALAAKLPLVPRYQQRLLTVPGSLGRPVWEDDPDFALVDHVHRAALPAPGGEAELQELVGRIMSEPLEHDRPLWEEWVVEGLADGRWALVTKVHHSMVDGIAGTDLLTTFFGPAPSVPPPPCAVTTSPPRTPGRRQLQLVAHALQADGADSWGAVRATVRAVGHPRSLVGTVRESARGLLAFLAAARPVSPSSLVGPLGSERLYRCLAVPLPQVLDIRTAQGCTVNDVVLAAVTHAFQALLIGRGEDPSRHAVRTLVPVSVRRPDQRGRLDNRVSAILLDLPVDEGDPTVALGVVAHRMRRLKASHEAEAGELVTSIANAVPPPGLAAALQLVFRAPQRFVTTVVTNVPGPREDLHLAGRRMVANYPYVPIADRLRTGVAVTSYDGCLYFGITADRDSTGDVDRFKDGLRSAFDELARCSITRS
jgi:diacylglycerol O-acyltransferase / wax synthase